MNERLFSLCKPCPEGFTFCGEFSERDFRRAAFALYAPSLDAARVFLGNHVPRLAGVILIPGDHYSFEEASPLFSEIIIPPSMLPFLADFAAHQLLQLDRHIGNEERHSFLALENKRFELNYQRATMEFNRFRASQQNKIEERRTTERQLAESDRKFRAIFDHTFQFIGLMALDGTLMEANRISLEFAGAEKDSIGKPFWETPWWSHSPELQEKLREAIKKAAKGEFVRFEATHQAADGKLHYVDFSLKPLTDESGKVVLLIPEGRDITARKMMEKAQTESEERYRRVVELSPDAVFIHTAGRFVFMNTTAARLLGAEWPETLYGRAALDFVHPDSMDAVVHRIENAWSHLDNPPLEELLVRLDGSTVPVEMVSVYFNYQGADSVLAVARDISERKRMQDELVKVQKLESLGLLAGGIAHDFNNILTGILGNLSLARLRLGPDNYVAKQINECEKATVRARDLAQQLLTFARGGEPVKKLLDPAALIREATSFVLHGSNVNCVIDIAQDLWCVEVDSGQISQVLQNILINARQAMPLGGEVTVQAINEIIGPVNLFQLPPDNYLKIVIKDNGCGIPAGHLPKIFDPYFTTKQEGSGLGLASVYSIVRRHGGTVEVVSTVGVGSSFIIHLPASFCTMPDDVVTWQDAKLVGNGRILIMDDEELIRDIATEILEFMGYDVETCTNGKEAVELFRLAHGRNVPFDAVILDLTIPGGIGGMETAGILLEIDPEAVLIVSSGYSNDPVVANFRQYGFRGVVLKPYSASSLAVELENLIAKT